MDTFKEKRNIMKRNYNGQNPYERTHETEHNIVTNEEMLERIERSEQLGREGKLHQVRSKQWLYTRVEFLERRCENFFTAWKEERAKLDAMKALALRANQEGDTDATQDGF